MSDGGEKLNVRQGPTLVYNPIREIQIYEIMEEELNTLDRTLGEELRALGFLSFAAGTLVSIVGNWIAASALSPTKTGVYVALVAVAGVVSVWSIISWCQARKRRKPLIATIKSRQKEAKGRGAN